MVTQNFGMCLSRMGFVVSLGQMDLVEASE